MAGQESHQLAEATGRPQCDLTDRSCQISVAGWEARQTPYTSEGVDAAMEMEHGEVWLGQRATALGDSASGWAEAAQEEEEEEELHSTLC